MFDQSTKLCDVKYKIVFLGPSSVGKSAIIERFSQKRYDQQRGETVGIDFIMKNIIYEGLVYRLQLWDTAGQEKFRSLIPTYIRDAHCAVFVFDTANKESFQRVDEWLQLFSDFKNEQAVTIMVGNKIDKADTREVSEQEAQAKADNYSMSYCQASAKTNTGIQELFQSIIANIRVTKKVQKSTNESEHNNSLTERRMNKNKLVKINKEEKGRLACCYI